LSGFLFFAYAAAGSLACFFFGTPPIWGTPNEVKAIPPGGAPQMETGAHEMEFSAPNFQHTNTKCYKSAFCDF